jgi:hypothetical protein
MKLVEIVEWLRDYPLKEEPYPEGYPDDLKYDPYPGRDFVLAICEEQMAEMLKISVGHKDKEIRKLAQGIAEVFREVYKDRKKKLTNP